MPEELKVGNEVKYSTKFLRSIGCYTGDIPFANGKIINIDGDIATINWKNPNLPKKANINNLVAASRIELA